MMKTITVRIDDNIYEILKKAADGERRTISNFIENASLQYLSSETYVSDSEMNSIVSDQSLT
ncbi:MAG: ribbon-helix-helix protein, CopG family, partial [Candidatus Delongbacteria bacterium]|nr:ribbon-helix-helix protein, CopG family [Candidatus Delongbacteria bacterium]MCG2759589.1 ribbon-helix-helix protein, CopG family [Candidatus Delongbacteria bacterium]